MNDDERILKAYKDTESIRGVTRKLDISEHRVRKILTAKGIVLNETHQRILELKKDGKNPEEISKVINMSIGVVKSYLPPVRPLYKINRSQNAVKIAEWRKRKNTIEVNNE